MGSSPLARGTLPLGDLHGNIDGLIPARAGNTILAFPFVENLGAHPRSRGEHRLPLNTVYEDMGSSPLARGTQVALEYGVRRHGLIPARAGNTLQGSTASPQWWAHPRSRGEHSRYMTGYELIYSSSPLARGTLGEDLEQGPVRGLIPARAGNTCCRS